MDITERKITKIAREAEMLVLRTLREEGVGTAEIDLIHALRHHPGCTQAALAELLHADKAAIARRTKNLETKGYLVRKDAPNDRRSQLLYPTEKAESLKSSKAEIEAAFYEYLTSTLSKEEAAAFAAALQKLYTASKLESRAGFPHFQKASGFPFSTIITSLWPVNFPFKIFISGNRTRFQFFFSKSPFFQKIVENSIIKPHTNRRMCRPAIRIMVADSGIVTGI